MMVAHDREMAQQGLTVSTNENQVSDPKQAYPSLESMMGYICERQPGVLAQALLGEQVMLFPPKAYMAMIKFLQQCYKSEQNTATVGDNDTLSTSEEIKEFERMYKFSSVFCSDRRLLSMYKSLFCELIFSSTLKQLCHSLNCM